MKTLYLIGTVLLLLALWGFDLQAQSGYSYDVTYDAIGIPHITAATDKSAVYGQGYEMAKAQGPLLYAIYAKAIGKYVKYYGGTHDMDDHRVRNDFRIALWGFNDLARRTYRRLEREEKQILIAFTDGVNDAMASSSVPPHWNTSYPGDMQEFQDGIKPWHVISAYLRYTYLSVLAKDVYNIGMPYHPGSDPLENTEFPNMNSNAWAILDSNEEAWLVVDPHNHLGNDEYLMSFGCSVISQQKLRWFGFNPLGLPLMGIGVKFANPNVAGSQNIGWTLTMAPPDMADVYEVHWNDVTKKYLFDGRWRPATMKTVTIAFPDSNDDWTLQVPVSPDHGPAIGYNSDKSKINFGRGVWQVWPASINFVKQWRQMLESHNMTDLRNAMFLMAFHGGNYIIATNSPLKGERITYKLFAPTPNRSTVPNFETIDWTHLVDGSSSANVWDRVHPFWWLPTATGDDQDYFINCNCSVDVTYPPFASQSPPYPNYLIYGYGVFTYRQERAEDLLASQSSINYSAMYDMVMDKSCGFARHNIPDLVAAYDVWKDNPGILNKAKLTSAKEMLGSWDRHYDLNSKPALLFDIWVTKFLAKGPYSAHFTFVDQRESYDLQDEDLCLDALNALCEAYEIWEDKDQNSMGEWGKNNLLKRGVSAGTKYFEVGGGRSCLRASHGDWQTDFSHMLIHGGQVVPTIIKFNLNGSLDIKYMKTMDNCTMVDSLMFDEDCPATTNWADGIFIDF